MKQILLVITTLLLLSYGCTQTFSPEEEKQMQVVKSLGRHLQCIPPRTRTSYSVEPMSDGYAVLVEPEVTSGTPSVYAYWVKGEEVYTVNEEAAKCSPGLPVAPKGITYESVYKTIQEAKEHW